MNRDAYHWLTVVLCGVIGGVIGTAAAYHLLGPAAPPADQQPAQPVNVFPRPLLNPPDGPGQMERVADLD